MAVQMHFAGLLFTRKLMRISASTQKHLCNRGLILKLNAGRGAIRTFSAGSVKCNENDGDKSQSSPLDTKQTPRQGPPFRRRRPLSPLERISGLLPQDSLSPEVMHLREQSQQDPVVEADLQVSVSTQEESRHETVHEKDDSQHQSASDTAMQPNTPETPHEAFDEETSLTPPALPGESRLVFGELLVAEYRRKGRVEFRKMFQLQTGTRLQSSWGTILHDDIAGQPAGRFLKTGRGVPILIRRASLEDYVLLMKRGPAIAYPKDAATMLMMMDVTEGDCVLESGSGSGAMSLFLSRAVGSKGSVLSVEVREDHHRRAVLNYRRWRTSWSLRRGEEWPDNVQFHNADLCTASSLLAGQGFNAVALDQIHPQLALPTVIPHLHSGAVCAVYLANITQVIDLLEGLRCLALPLLCERIIEVPLRDWLVAPALQKDGRFCIRKAPIVDADEREEDDTPDDTSNETDEDEMTTEKHPAFGSIPYIARPHPEQMSHTAFLVKLRKCAQ